MPGSPRAQRGEPALPRACEAGGGRWGGGSCGGREVFSKTDTKSSVVSVASMDKILTTVFTFEPAEHTRFCFIYGKTQ